MTDYVLKGIALADFGRKELDIAVTEIPRLMELRSECGKSKPLKGTRIVGSASYGDPAELCDWCCASAVDLRRYVRHRAGKKSTYQKAVSDCLALTPRGICTNLGLNKPIYQRTASYGHFCRAPDTDGGFSFQHTNLIDALKAML